MKKIISTLVLLAVPFGVFAYGDSFFNDIQDSPNIMAIENLYTRGIINGYEDGSFKPNDYVNRAEALKLTFVSLARYTDYSPEATSFSDVDSGDWFYDYVLDGVALSMLNGYPDGTFKPSENVNLAEFMKMHLTGFPFYAESWPVNGDPYNDVDEDAWFASYAAYAKEKNLLDAAFGEKINPSEDMSREEVAEFIYRSLFVSENYGIEFNPYHESVESADYYINIAVPKGFELENIGGEFNVTHPYYPNFVMYFVSDFSPNTSSCLRTENGYIENHFGQIFDIYTYDCPGGGILDYLQARHDSNIYVSVVYDTDYPEIEQANMMLGVMKNSKWSLK